MSTSDSRPLVPLDASVGDRLVLAAEHFGRAEFVERAIALLGGANAGEEFLLWVGGRHADGVLSGAPPLYWPEVWGARALLHVWDESAATAIVVGLRNQAWRVREMCGRVCAAHAIAAHDELVALLGDDVPRVRSAAAVALGAVGDADDVPVLQALLRDKEIDVRRAAGAAVARLRGR